MCLAVRSEWMMKSAMACESETNCLQSSAFVQIDIKKKKKKERWASTSDDFCFCLLPLSALAGQQSYTIENDVLMMMLCLGGSK